jgi:hypothetical protein
MPSMHRAHRNLSEDHFRVRDSRTRLVHIAGTYVFGEQTIHATLCLVEVEPRWPAVMRATPVTCLMCIAAEEG